jgi:ubiquinone/menaquinone biosynthesis C-methylase UbiE
MENQKRRQVEYHEKEHFCARLPRMADNSNPLIAWLNNYRLRKMLEMIGAPLAGKSVLSVCGGDGQEADFLQRQGAVVTMTDLSAVGVDAARVRNPGLRCLRMDTEALAFRDASFDWVVVRDGLHHLARPVQGLYELERISREGFVILEGQDSWLVRLLVKVGLGENWDPAGGYVYRFSRRELCKILTSVRTVSRWLIFTAWLPPGSDALNHFSSVMRFVNSAVNHQFINRILTSKPGRSTLKSIFRAFQFLAGRWGNSLILVAWKKPAQPAHLALAAEPRRAPNEIPAANARCAPISGKIL